MLRFPAAFRFGAATSAHQVEGNQHNTWSEWETLPQFAAQVVEPSGIADDEYRRFEEDLDWVASMGLDTYRFSVEWSRIEPVRGQIDEAALAHYRAELDALHARGLRASVTLHHFTEPTWFVNLAGIRPGDPSSYCPEGPTPNDFCSWSNPESPSAFGTFCGVVAAALGNRVDEWMTINELTGYWLNSSVSGTFPPGLVAASEPLRSEIALPRLRNLITAHVACYHAIHARDRVDADGDGAPARVGLTIGTGAVRPARPDSSGDVRAARTAEALASFQVFDALTGAGLDTDLDGVPDEPHPEWAGTLDLLGLQYYASTVVVGLPFAPPFSALPCSNVEPAFLVDLELALGCPPPPTPDFPLGPEPPQRTFGLQHDPEGLGEVLDHLVARYPALPIVITENGFADDADKRASSIVRHLRVAHEAIARGVPLEGYYHWSLLDNFEWGRGFGVRFGLIAVARDRDLARSPTVAAEVYGEIARAHGLSARLLAERDGAGALP